MAGVKNTSWIPFLTCPRVGESPVSSCNNQSFFVCGRTFSKPGSAVSYVMCPEEALFPIIPGWLRRSSPLIPQSPTIVIRLLPVQEEVRDSAAVRETMAILLHALYRADAGALLRSHDFGRLVARAVRVREGRDPSFAKLLPGQKRLVARKLLLHLRERLQLDHMPLGAFLTPRTGKLSAASLKALPSSWSSVCEVLGAMDAIEAILTHPIPGDRPPLFRQGIFPTLQPLTNAIEMQMSSWAAVSLADMTPLKRAHALHGLALVVRKSIVEDGTIEAFYERGRFSLRGLGVIRQAVHAMEVHRDHEKAELLPKPPVRTALRSVSEGFGMARRTWPFGEAEFRRAFSATVNERADLDPTGFPEVSFQMLTMATYFDVWLQLKRNPELLEAVFVRGSFTEAFRLLVSESAAQRMVALHLSGFGNEAYRRAPFAWGALLGLVRDVAANEEEMNRMPEKERDRALHDAARLLLRTLEGTKEWSPFWRDEQFTEGARALALSMLRCAMQKPVSRRF
jgi:hypothetical protein